VYQSAASVSPGTNLRYYRPKVPSATPRDSAASRAHEMASFRGSFNSANLPPSQALRPILQRRAQSSSSEASCGSASPASEDQFVFSVGNTPSNEHPPSAAPVSRTMAPTSAPREGLLFGKQTATATISEIPDSHASVRSKPIAIELPTVRRVFLDPESAPADTPPEPLSARGDIPG
jgi:hypothetical protein